MKKLSLFLGMDKNEIKEYFYKEHKTLNLFGDETSTVIKEEKAIKKIIHLYKERLKSIWKNVSEAYPMRNTTGSVMFHFLLASQNIHAVKIADDIIGKKLWK